MDSITAKNKQAERMKKWREANKEAVKAYNKEWRKNNKEHRKEYKKKYQKENRESHLANGREYYWNKLRTSRLLRPRDIEGERKYKALHKEKISVQSFTRTHTARAQVLQAYGNQCACCGEKEAHFLAIDHKNNDGNVMRKNKVHPSGGYGFYIWLIKNNFPNNFQILCNNCNLAKARLGYCPHEKVRSIT